MLKPTVQLQHELVQDMIARTGSDPAPLPEFDANWAYITRFSPGAQYPTYLRRPRKGTKETVLLDVAARADSRPYFSVRNVTHSPDQSLFAWAEDTTGSEKFTIQVKDILTGNLMPDPPTSAFGDFVFSPDSKWLFWVWRDANSRPARLYRRLARGGHDELVYEEKDPAYLLEVLASASRQYLFIRCWNDVTSEVRIISGNDPTSEPTLVALRQVGIFYDVEHWRDDFVIRTNADGAEDFKIMRTPISTPQREHWQPWIPVRPGRFITELKPFAGHLVWLERVEGNAHVNAVGADRSQPYQPIRFDEPAYSLSLVPSEYARDTLRLKYQSPRTPEQWLSCDLTTGKRRLLARTELSKGYSSSDYVVARLHATAPDGAQVPITVLRSKKTKLDGSAPLLLTGYGAYGYSYETGFSLPLISLIDRGWIWAVAHVRGGSEKGWQWFEQARRFSKKTSFTDFIACAEELITQRHAAKKRIVLHGYSAGGLLVGAAENMRPDMWGAVIGQAPFVDMLNTMSDATHPLVPLTRPVWGDPLSDPKAYDYIASYSPYDNVRPEAYPPTLATTAIADDRVGFWEPAKWIAKLRELSTSDQPMLLHTEMAGGHHGAGGRFEEYTQVSRMYAFAIEALRP